MKKQTLFIIFIGFYAVIGHAQNEYYAGMPIQPKCPCGMAIIFKERQMEMTNIRYSRATKCHHETPTTYVPSNAPEGFYLFKRRKKKPQPQKNCLK